MNIDKCLTTLPLCKHTQAGYILLEMKDCISDYQYHKC